MKSRTSILKIFARDLDAVIILSEMFVITRGTRGKSRLYLKLWLPVAEKI